MENILKTSIVILWSLLILSSCSSNESDTPEENPSDSFVIDGEMYSIKTAGLTVGGMDPENPIVSILLTGINGSKTGTISFAARFSNATGVTGTYTAGAGEAVNTPGFYASHLAIYTTTQNGTNPTSGGYGKGPLRIISHGDDEYTVEFVVTYQDEVESSASIRRVFTNYSTD